MNLGMIIDNNEFEIKKAAESFFDLINNDFSLDEILQKQKNYWQTVEKYFGFKNKIKPLYVLIFISNNDYLKQ